MRLVAILRCIDAPESNAQSFFFFKVVYLDEHMETKRIHKNGNKCKIPVVASVYFTVYRTLGRHLQHVGKHIEHPRVPGKRQSAARINTSHSFLNAD